MSGQRDPATPTGGAPQGDPAAASPSETAREDRIIRRAPIDDPGVGDDGGWAGPGTEHSGYGNTPPR